MRATKTVAEEQAEADVRRRWQTDAALRAEFGNGLAACIALHKAEARGATRNHRGSVTRVLPKARA
jgi:hypothetical protein